MWVVLSAVVVPVVLFQYSQSVRGVGCRRATFFSSLLQVLSNNNLDSLPLLL